MGRSFRVLILIVMEDGLVHIQQCGVQGSCRLNPYCDGRWSRTMKISVKGGGNLVLILIVMEDGLVLDLIRLF